MSGQGAEVPLADIAHTVNLYRSRHNKIATVSARDRDEAIAGLRALAAGKPTPGVVAPHEVPRGKGTVFLYSGQGSQWAGMGRQLLADEPAFAAAVDGLESDFVAQVGFSLKDVLLSGEPVVGIDRIQPVLVGMQLALTALWRSYGVEPDAVIGHSMGEVTAAVVSGALSPADGLKVIATRSKLMSRLSGQGAMALLELGAAEAEKLVGEHPDITVAVYAAPQQTVIAGPPDQVDAVVAIVDAQGKLARRVEVDVASHHPTVDPILADLKVALADLKPQTPTIPLISTVGQSGDAAPKFDAEYWVVNLRSPVRFSQAVSTAAENHAAFVEVSPHPLLSHAINGTLESAKPRGGVVSGTLTRDNPETLSFHTQLATVRPPSVTAAQNATGTKTLIDLPPTPWQHVRYWAAPTATNRQQASAHPLLGTHVELPSGRDHVFTADVGTELLPYMLDHKVHGQPVMPGTGFGEIALAAASEALGLPATSVSVGVEVEQMLPLAESTQLTTQLSRGEKDGDEIRVEIHSRSASGAWIRHAVAKVEVGQSEPPTVPPASSEAGTVLSPADLYAALRATGLHHAEAFAALTRIVRRPNGTSETEIVLPDKATAHRGYRIHPVLLDAALQGLAAALSSESLADADEATYLPVSFEKIRVFGDVGRRGRCRAELTNTGDSPAGVSGITGRVLITDESGKPTAEISGIYLQRVQRRSVPLPLEQKIFDTEWVETPVDTAASAPEGSWLVLTDGAESEAVAKEFTTAFSAPNRRVLIADLGRESAVLEAFSEAAGDAELPPVGVVIFAGRQSFDGTESGDAPGRGRDLTWGLASTVRTIVTGWHGKPPRLWVVSRDGLAVNEGEAGDPSVNALTGLIRVLAYEHPDLRTTLVDLHGDSASQVAVLAAEFGLTGDDIIAWRDEKRYAKRLSRATLAAATTDTVVRSDGSYILTGGLRGLGLAMARWLVDSGAGRVVLNGRSEPSEEAQALIEELQQRAQIAVVLGDIAAPGVAEKLVGAAEETGLALRGLMHSAVVLDDQIVAGLSQDSLERVWSPKAHGALRLHAATAGKSLDWWVGFSSTSSLLGAPGQGAYAAASAWLDGLVDWRRASGLPATTINWGQWSDIGVARALTFSALDPISPAEGIEALEAILAAQPTNIGVARLRLDRAAAAFPEIQQLGYFAKLAEELDIDSEDDDWAGPDALREMDPADVSRVIVARLSSRILAIMGYPKGSTLEADQPLTELGMDSLMAVRIRNTVRGDFGVEPPVALLLQGASLTALTTDLIRQLGLETEDKADSGGGVRDRANKRAAARQRAAARRKVGDRV
jgi:phthiocerol/phenolphthiocerol synthesis type-I polyketide synthase D